MKNCFIHATATVEVGAALGSGVKVWDLARVRTGSSIGDETVIGRSAFIDTNVRVGARCKIQNNALIYEGAELEDGVFIGPAAVITNDLHPRAVSRSGALKGPSDWTLGKVIIEEGASIGAGAVIVTGVRIGGWSMVAAGAVVTRDVAPSVLVAGVPAYPVGFVCYCGIRRDGGCDDCGWQRPSSR